MFESLLKKPSGKGLLVLKTDCLGLHASIVTGNKQELSVTHTATSREVEPLAAMMDVITQLKNASGKNLPRDAVLLHINAIPSRVEMTQSADVSGDMNLAEMMRWEMDSVVADQSPLWDLGWILYQRHYINLAQYEQLLSLVITEKRLSVKHGGRSAMRVGEIAVREHFATQDQIAECLAIQEKLQLPDQRLLTQWRPLPDGGLDNEMLGEQVSQAAYLCSAMPITQHLQWVNAFKKLSHQKGFAKLELKHVYSMAGSTLPLIDAEDERVLVTEFHPAYAFCAVLEHGVLQDTMMFKASSQPLDAEVIIESLNEHQFTQVDNWIVANIDGVDVEFIEVVESGINLRPQFLPKASSIKLSAQQNSKYSHLAELGCAAHMLGLAPLMVSPLPGMPPPEPIYKRKAFRISMAAAMVPVIVLGYEGVRQWQIQQLQSTLAAKEKQLDAYGDDKGVQASDVKKAEKNIAQYKSLEQELNSLNYKKELVQSVMIKRQNVIEKLLPTLAHSVNDGVIIDSLNETNWYQFTLTGRAVDQNSVDEFNRVLSINLQPLNLYILNSPSRLDGQDSYNYSGVYIFEFTIQQRASL